MRWGAAGCFVLFLVGCGATSGSDEQDGPYLRLADQDDITTLDPARGYDTASWQFEEMLFNTLLDYDASANLVGELATDWEISPDHLTYTFHLRDDVRFSNGRPVAASDLRY